MAGVVVVLWFLGSSRFVSLRGGGREIRYRFGVWQTKYVASRASPRTYSHVRLSLAPRFRHVEGANSVSDEPQTITSKGRMHLHSEDNISVVGMDLLCILRRKSGAKVPRWVPTPCAIHMGSGGERRVPGFTPT